MTDLDFSRLTQLAEDGPVVKPRRSVASADPMADLRDGPDMRVMAVDQSLRNTGQVIVVRIEGAIHVNLSKTIRPKVGQSLKGFAQDCAYALALEDALEWSTRDFHALIHETPPFGKVAGPSGGISSKMAALAVRSAWHRQGMDSVVHSVQAQRARTWLTGNSRADKKEAHESIASLDITYHEHATNEHERDALLLALFHIAHTKKV